MNDNLIAIVVAVASLLVALASLYFSHLRGPRIDLAESGKVYPCHMGKDVSLFVSSTLDEKGSFYMESNLLLANTGPRSGVLFNVGVEAGDEIVKLPVLDPAPEQALPRTLSPGEGWQTRLSFQIQRGEDGWGSVLDGLNTVTVRVTYLRSTGLGLKRKASRRLCMDLTPLHEHIREDWD